MCKNIWQTYCMSFLLLNTIFYRNNVKAQFNIPQNSCPQYFEYVNNGNEIEGQIKLKFRINDAVIRLVFEASVPARLTSVSI